jgi:hypothetical protein
VTQLFEALRRAGCGENYGGVVLLMAAAPTAAGWKTVKCPSKYARQDATFIDQDVQFNDRGFTKVADTNERMPEVRILVMVRLQRMDVMKTAAQLVRV